VIVTVDVIASVTLIVFGLVFAFTAVGYGLAFGTITSTCDAGPHAGLTCNSTALSIAAYGLIVIAILAFAVGLGMVIVSLIRRRFTFWWPLGALVVMIIAFYLATWVAGATAPPA
jgi:hypothetical protein